MTDLQWKYDELCQRRDEGNTEARGVGSYEMEIEEGEIDQDGLNIERGRDRGNVERDNAITRNKDNREHKEGWTKRGDDMGEDHER